ncbi:MAG: MiaB/RimO family radical SAM methylthiotransferase, partial [Bacteroidales bacterium]|nr:MiaB/RimO family radical SAM methylthiotransferase [Bacteroidales bacterium]
MTAISMQTFGCKLNFSETTSIGKKLKEGGHSIVDSIQQADIHIINSCTVTEHAEKKCRQAIRHAVSVNPSIKIIIIGCYSQLRPEELAEMPNVVFVCGNETKFKLPEIIDGMTKDTIKISSPDDSKHFSYHPAISDDSRTRSFLKIQDGCDYFCTYCAIPYSRGRSRSDTVENVIKSARKAVDDGKKEIVLDGVNIGEFGKKNGESLYMLLNELIAIDGLKRIRISSIEPNLLESRIINLLSETDKLMPHFHIPLQCGSDRILKLMHRRYDTSFFRDKLLEIKAIKPLCCLAVDLITGFPGETTQDFAD